MLTRLLDKPKTLNKPLYLFLFLVLFFAVKWWFSEAIPLRASQMSKYDGLLFQKIAQNIIMGNWLGEYNRYILTKGPGYPLWIAFTWFLSIPLRFANEILYFLSAAILFRLLYLLKMLNWFSLLGVLIFLFNPATLNNWYWGAFMRQNIYFSLCAISFFSLMISYYYICYLEKVPFFWILLSGMALGYAWITREETIWMVPMFLGVFFYSLLVGGLSYKIIARKLVLFVVPFSLLFIINTVVCAVNYEHYKFYGTSEMKSKEMSDAWNAVVGVQHKAWKQYRPMRTVSLKEINQYSSSMREVEKYLRKTDDNGTEIPHEWNGATAMLTFRHAVAKAGYYKKDFVQTSEYYTRLAQEINAACEKGQLKCKDPLFNTVHWYDPYYQQIVPTYVAVIKSLAIFDDYEIALRYDNVKGSRGYNKRIESLAHRSGGHPMRQEETKLYPSYQIKQLAFKTKVLEEIISIYRKYSCWLFLLSLVILPLYLIKGDDKRQIKQTVALVVIISLGSILAIVTINVLLAITAYRSWVRPLMTATPFYLVIISTLFFMLPKTLNGVKKYLFKRPQRQT